MNNQIYNPLTYTPTQSPAFGAVDAWNSGRRDFLAEMGNIQSLEALMRGNQQADAELQRYKAMTPLMLEKEGYAADEARAKRQDPGFIPSVLRGEKADHSIKEDRARMSRGTVQGEMDTKNMGNINAQLEQAGHFLNMVTQQAGPEQANQLYVGVLKQLPQNVARMMPPSYDPESFQKFLQASTMSADHRRSIGLENVRGGNRLAETRLQGDYGLAREELQQLAANQRTGAEIQGRNQVARTMAGARENMETPQRAIARLRRSLTQNPGDQEALFEYKMYLEDEWNKRVQNDPTVMLARLRMFNAKDPESQESAAAKYAELRDSFYSEKGLHKDAPPAGTIMEGKNGKKFRFKGFPYKPKGDPNAWEEVK